MSSSKMQEIAYPVYVGKIASEELAAKMCTLALLPFYKANLSGEETVPDHKKLLGSTVAILRIFSDLACTHHGDLQLAFQVENLKLVEKSLTLEVLNKYWAKFWPQLKKLMNLPEWPKATSSVLIVSMSILFLINTKNVKLNWTDWFRDQWIFMYCISDMKMASYDIKCPGEEYCLTFKTVMSIRPTIMKALVSLIWELSITSNWQYKKVFEALYSQLKEKDKEKYDDPTYDDYLEEDEDVSDLCSLDYETDSDYSDTDEMYNTLPDTLPNQSNTTYSANTYTYKDNSYSKANNNSSANSYAYNDNSYSKANNNSSANSYAIQNKSYLQGTNTYSANSYAYQNSSYLGGTNNIGGTNNLGSTNNLGDNNNLGSTNNYSAYSYAYQDLYRR